MTQKISVNKSGDWTQYTSAEHHNSNSDTDMQGVVTVAGVNYGLAYSKALRRYYAVGHGTRDALHQ